jgi:hypothetical protein
MIYASRYSLRPFTFLIAAASEQKFYFTMIKTYEMIMVSRWNPQPNKRSKPGEGPVFLIYTKFI